MGCTFGFLKGVTDSQRTGKRRLVPEWEEDS